MPSETIYDPLPDYLPEHGEFYKRAAIDMAYLDSDELAAQIIIRTANHNVFPDASIFLTLERRLPNISGLVFDRVDELAEQAYAKREAEQRKEHWRQLFVGATNRMHLFRLGR
jgi:hypothetical protein